MDEIKSFKYYLIFIIFINLTLFTQGQTSIITIKSVKFDTIHRNKLETGRDGLVIVTLDTNEETSICNYNFDNIDANIVCKTLGYPAQGYAVKMNTAGWLNQSTDVLVGDFQCTGSEKELSLCSYSGRKKFGGDCGLHHTDAYVYCLENKVVPPVADVTICTNQSSVALATNSGNKNIGNLLINGAYVCMRNFEIDSNLAQFYCGQMCSNTSRNPNVVFNINPFLNTTVVSLVTVHCSSKTLCTATSIGQCRSGDIIGVQCGEEVQIQEPAPLVQCSSKNMLVTWNSTSMKPPISADMVSLNIDCANNSDAYTNGDVFGFNISLVDNTRVQDAGSSISYSCSINRFYSNNCTTSVCHFNTVRTRCLLIKQVTGFQTVDYRGVTSASVIRKFKIITTMTFHAIDDTTKELPLKVPFNAKTLFVAVNLQLPPPEVQLILQTCYVSDKSDGTSQNRIRLVVNSCPNTTEKVVMRILLYGGMGFQFDLTNTARQFKKGVGIYVVCLGEKCYQDETDKCAQCSGPIVTRRKRSTTLIRNKVVVSAQLPNLQ